MFRFLHCLIKRPSVSHKPLLFNSLYMLTGFFVASIPHLNLEGRLGGAVSGIGTHYEEAMQAGDPAPRVARVPSRQVLLFASEALHIETRQVAMEPDGEGSKSGIRRVCGRASPPTHEICLQGGLVDD